MSREAVDRTAQRIADHHRKQGKEVNSREVQKKAIQSAERVDRRNGNKRG
jgi:hypothetical protein